MRERFDFKASEAAPDRLEILRSQGMPPEMERMERIESLVRDSADVFRALAVPSGVFEEVSVDEFARIYDGEGDNEPRTPLAGIFPAARRLALFCVTLGDRISKRIQGFFEAHDFAVGYMLDAAASLGADRTADLLQERAAGRFMEEGPARRPMKALRYSPGYCGWHIHGQRKLFERLRPAEIGVSLNESCLMQPLKSVSGVIVYGPREIHRFDNSYPFCGGCTHQSCRERIESL